ncbi:MAG: hypothetical protein JAY85_07940 [Candidatus Thiodiazotropha weberae]|uniref:Uncharacterized protein n=1 Tax=Candidatus Thiodiazotropha endoloripes TaxID=1818881 RepID=A0A1E2USK2_9GAMM|nr:hypothetical protein [Candidatus Thiodiazotropha endoloripes]MCG7898373.1 hypothetical protein [Candidatus Thiodiazotropha weberae]ODB86434.1 hypothetical protein A3195_12550 [Candidatus Thiodiazotropha endoloripes]ODB88464.1 hypothetical protein A3193_06340 [Candidatus Thiodiazotropha endoloripes]ODB97552.1 hypothetical protein A3196_12780 [Candidatus Thiodiazotropha endoloripes]
MNEKKAPVVTALSETMKNPRPLTTEERNKLLSEWADRTLNELLGYSLIIPGFKEKLYSSVIDHFSTDDDLTFQMLKKIQGLRKGKRGRREKWNYSRYYHLLMVYSICTKQEMDRDDLLKKLAKMEGVYLYDGDKAIENTKEIERRITLARKRISKKKIEEALSRVP